MKRFLVFLMVCLCAFEGFGQNPEIQVDRRIYLWDVTWSMQGHKKMSDSGTIDEMYPYIPEMDIWDSVASFIKNDINNISNTSTDLILFPFLDRKHPLDVLTVKANSSGKAELIKYIDEAKKRFTTATYTNIVQPLQKVMTEYIVPERNNLIILMTDGQSNDGADNQMALKSLLSQWDAFAVDNNTYLIYMMLAKAAQDDDIKKILEDTVNGEVVPPENFEFEFMDIYPATAKINFNVTDSADGLNIPIKNTKQTLAIPKGVRLAVKSAPDALITIDEEAEIEDNALKITLNYSSKELKDLMGTDESVVIPLTLELLNRDEIQQQHKKRLILKHNEVELELINKIQKILTITLKR